MVKKSIYTPAKGVRLSRKKLYKLKQLGGGLLETLFGGDNDDLPIESPDDVQDGEGESIAAPSLEEDNAAPSLEEDNEKKEEEKEEKEDDEGVEQETVEEKNTGVLDTMMGTLDAVGTSAKETLDDMTTGNEPTINLDSEESSVLLNKDDEIRRLREENNKLLEENRELSLRLIQHLDTKIDTLEKVDTPEEPSVIEEEPSVVEEEEEEPSVVEEEEKEEEPSVVEEEENTVLEIPDDGQQMEEQNQVQEEEEKEDEDLEVTPLTPREKALGGRKHNKTRRKRK